jgi:hypothetical protein
MTCLVLTLSPPPQGTEQELQELQSLILQSVGSTADGGALKMREGGCLLAFTTNLFVTLSSFFAWLNIIKVNPPDSITPMIAIKTSHNITIIWYL